MYVTFKIRVVFLALYILCAMKNIFEIVSPIMAFIAIVLSYQNYLRQKTFENENLLFKFKLEKYNELLSKIKEILNFVENDIHELYTGIEGKSFSKDDIDGMLDNFDSRIGQAELDLFSNSAFLPEKVLDEIEAFLEKLNSASFLMGYKMVNYDMQLKKLDEIGECIYEIAEVMRKDIGFEPLNKKLHKRTSAKI